MNARTIRRAIERKAKKQAHKEEVEAVGIAVDAAPAPFFPDTVEIDTVEEQPATAVIPQPISQPQLLANQRNAALSTGPKTPAGKAIASRNALKTGLTGQTVLPPPPTTPRSTNITSKAISPNSTR